MSNTYFEHILSRCQRNDIQRECAVFKSMDELLAGAKRAFQRPVVPNFRIPAAIDEELKRIDYHCLSMDAKKVFERVNRKNKYYSDLYSAPRVDNDYEGFFDVLVDACWLFASLQVCPATDKQRVFLLDNFTLIPVVLRKYLYNTYYRAEDCVIEYLDVSDALELRKIWNSQRATNQRTVDYYNSDYSNDDLCDLMDGIKNRGLLYHALFFGLTVTSIRADEIGAAK